MRELAIALGIPAISGVVGWGTNALAVRMLFQPLERRGLGPVAWQGVIPARAEYMATLCADLMLDRLITPAELYRRLDHREVASLLGEHLLEVGAAAADEVIAARYPRLWRHMPQALRERVMTRIGAALPVVVERVMDDVERDLPRFLDVRALVIDAFSRDRALLSELFRRCGEREFRFIITSGLGFGLVLGLGQLAAWAVAQPTWSFPLVGALVGGVTNWVALQMIFAPLRERRWGRLRLHGLFLKRQAAVSAAYANFFAERVLTPERLLRVLTCGPAAEALARSIERHTVEAIDDALGRSASAVRFAVGGEQAYAELRQRIARELTGRVELGATLEPYVADRFDLERTLRERLGSLPPAQFVSVLRPVFQQDEWRLTAIGAALGAAAGGLQLLALLG